MIIGFDIDGVIAPNPWLESSSEKVLGIAKVARLIKVSIRYLTRKPVPERVEWLKGYRKYGYRIVIISGIWEIVRPMIWLWLKFYHIPFDKLVLRKKDEVSKFKAKAIEKHKCEMFVEDQKDLMRKIRKLLADKGYGNIKVVSWRMPSNLPEFFILTFTPPST